MADFVSHHLFGEQALAVFPAPVQALAESRPACFTGAAGGGPAVLPESPVRQPAA